MPDKAVPVRGFGAGLNLHDRADVVKENEALDGLNVMHTRRGAVLQRDGFEALTAGELTNQPDSMSPYTSGSTRYLVVGGGNRLDSLNTSGVSAANATPTASPHFFAEFGSPGTDSLYCSNGTDEIRQLSATTFSTPDYEDETNTDVAPKSKYVAVWKDRLVGAENTNSTGFSTASNKDSVRFTDAGDPTTWTQNNYIQLSPGDGEPIMGVIAWRELLFVFKQTKFFVFYGTSVDSSGNPVFNYRPVVGGVGLASARALCAGRDGVYFMDRKGVYRTTGQEAEYVSENIEPIFLGDPAPFFLGGTLLASQITNCAMTITNERLYLGYTSTGTTNDYMLVYDIRYDWWELYDIYASCMATFRPSNTDTLAFGYSSGPNYVGIHEGVGWDSSSNTTDAGASITSRWRSGWYDEGTPDVKTIRASRVTGEGRFSLSVTHDYEPSSDADDFDFTASQTQWDEFTWDNAVWGPTASYGTQSMRKGPRGMLFSTVVEGIGAADEGLWDSAIWDESVWGGVSEGWTLHRLDHQIRGVRSPGTAYVDAEAA